MAYLEAADGRLARSHTRAVEAVRSGYIFAHDHKAHLRWLSHQGVRPGAAAGSGGRGLAGAELEQVVMGMAVTNPDIVAIRVH